MSRLHINIIIAIVATILVNYEPIYAGERAVSKLTSRPVATASASAAAAAAAASSSPGETAPIAEMDETVGHTVAAPEPLAPELEKPDAPSEFMDPVLLLRKSFANEFAAHADLYDHQDVENLLNDPMGIYAREFLGQRSNDWQRAYWLAVETLRWRAKLNVNQLDASQFPCDIFRMGLIFEFGNAYKTGNDGEYVTGNPVIWIRLGALGSVVKQLEKITAQKVVSYTYNTARAATHVAKSTLLQVTRKERRSRRRGRRSRRARKQRVADLSLRYDKTMVGVWKAIAWWLNDWKLRHPQGTQATLVLDFENNDFALSSWSMGDFFIGLDDHFPLLFDQMIGFRFKPKLWSLHSPISMFNRIFKSRISSSPETDQKLKFIKKEPQISTYMPRVDAQGYSLLPEHVHGTCLGPTQGPPAGCQNDVNVLTASGLYDPTLLQAIQHEFYQICKPRLREDQA